MLPSDEWSEVFGSERLTGALKLDRLTHARSYPGDEPTAVTALNAEPMPTETRNWLTTQPSG